MDSIDTKELNDNEDMIIQIEQNEIEYTLNISAKKDKIAFIINDKNEISSFDFIRKMNFDEIKTLNKAFNLLNSIKDFFDYLKISSEKNKIRIKKFNNKIKLILCVEVLLKEQEIEIELYPEKKDVNSSINEIYLELAKIKKKIKDNEELKKEIDFLKKDNKELRAIIENQNKEINILKESLFNFMNKSIIMRDDDKSFIYKEIENKMNKSIKEIKKLYQATIDGGDPIDFHSKCDNIPNTLVLIKSEDNKRFGGFTPLSWKSEGDYLNDKEKKTFIFSLDNKQIFQLKDGKNALYLSKNSGPCFGYGPDIGILGNPIDGKKLHLMQTTFYNKERNDIYLTDYQGRILIKALEYEVFQILFN